jgi:DNA polymerase lambda
MRLKSKSIKEDFLLQPLDNKERPFPIRDRYMPKISSKKNKELKYEDLMTFKEQNKSELLNSSLDEDLSISYLGERDHDNDLTTKAETEHNIEEMEDTNLNNINSSNSKINNNQNQNQKSASKKKERVNLQDLSLQNSVPVQWPTLQKEKKINLNEHITSELEKVLEYHQINKNEFQAVAYRRAIAQLKSMKETISSKEQIQGIKYIGKSIGKKIEEILQTGKLKVNETIESDEKTESLKQLMKVYGIGKVFANRLWNKKIRSLKELRKHPEMLNEKQKIGLKYCEELSQKIPRDECEKIYNIIKNALIEILPEKLVVIMMCGSYRRGKPYSSDIDILITRNDEGSLTGVLDHLLKILTNQGLIKETLAHSNTDDFRYQFMGVGKIEGSIHRRIDIKIYKKEHFPFSLLYFTGSANFNRLMRLYANRKGYILNDIGLEFVDGQSTKSKSSVGNFIECKSEKEIFYALGLKYVEPEDRDI